MRGDRRVVIGFGELSVPAHVLDDGLGVPPSSELGVQRLAENSLRVSPAAKRWLSSSSRSGSGRLMVIFAIPSSYLGRISLHLYDSVMQIAVVLPDEQVDELDRLVPGEFSSRAEAVRTAVAMWLAEHRALAVDQRYDAAYSERPAPADDVGSGRLRKGHEPPGGVWADLDW